MFYVVVFFSSGACEQEAAHPQDHLCYPCNWAKSSSTEPDATLPGGSLPSDGMSSRLSWPNNFSGGESHDMDELLPTSCRSYYSYPRKRSPSTPKACTSSLVDFDGREHAHCSKDFKMQNASLNQFCTKSSSYNSEMYRDKPIEECNTKQSLSCPILPPRTSKTNAVKTYRDVPSGSVGDSQQEVSHGLPAPHEHGTEESSSDSVDCPSFPPTAQW